MGSSQILDRHRRSGIIVVGFVSRSIFRQRVRNSTVVSLVYTWSSFTAYVQHLIFSEHPINILCAGYISHIYPRLVATCHPSLLDSLSKSLCQKFIYPRRCLQDPGVYIQIYVSFFQHLTVYVITPNPIVMIGKLTPYSFYGSLYFSLLF